MPRWFRITLYIAGSLIVLAIVFVGAVGLYLRQSSIAESSGTIADWKKFDWISSKDLPLVTKALIAAEDSTFSTEPRLTCGLLGLLTALRTHNEFMCSPIISHAARLAVSEKYMRTVRRMIAEIFIQGDLSGRPDEALDIILNKTYLGAKEDGAPIEGFGQASTFYFGQKPELLSISQAALLAGMVRAPIATR